MLGRYAGGRDDRRLPFSIGERLGQVPNDITDAANLAVGERAVLRREQEYSLAVDRRSPVLTNEVQILH